MSVKFLVDRELIPDDGSLEVINDFDKNTKCDIYVYPDVHYKRHSKMANGTLISSPNSIFLSCLGVENCGFTFGSIEGASREALVNSFAVYSAMLKTREGMPKYTTTEVLGKFRDAIRGDFAESKAMYDFLGFDSVEEVLKASEAIINGKVIDRATKCLSVMGGGNHFFELHEIIESNSEDEWLQQGRYVFMLHSDSINVGDLIFNLYSDLYEMRHNSGSPLKSLIAVTLFKVWRRRYFRTLGIDIAANRKDFFRIMSGSRYESLDADSELGKSLILAHHLAALFGDMNRREIIMNWADSQGIDIEIQGNHSHDMLSVEKNHGELKITHRNGVQLIGDDKYCVLPGAMGTVSFIMYNEKNEDAYYSTNHGVGRIQDKHIARNEYTEEDTCRELQSRSITLFKVKSGNMAEQDSRAFKDPESIRTQMAKYGLSRLAAKTYPIAIIKE